MKKFLLCIESLFIALILTACQGYCLEDWSINTIELAEEYFPKYFEYARRVIDDYNLEYQLESKRNDDKNFLIWCDTFTFNLNLKLYLTIDYDINCPNASSYRLLVEYDVSGKNDIVNFPNKFFEIMNRINEFCVYDLHGNEITYKHLFDQAYTEFQDEGMGWSDYQYGPLDWVRYRIKIQWNDGTQRYRTSIDFRSVLTDENILNKKGNTT